MSCGAACARQLLADDGITISEEILRSSASFDPRKGIYGIDLASALDGANSKKTYTYAAIDPSSLKVLMKRAPFIAMLVAHWVIVDGFAEDGSILVRDPAPLPSASHIGTEGRIERAVFDDVWARGAWQVIYAQSSEVA